jgi:hypothetical protein
MSEKYYNRIIEKMTEYSCQLLTTPEEYFEMKKNTKIPKVKYIASCGHENTVHVNVFCSSRPTGIKCPSCILRENGLKKKGKMVCDNGQSLYSKYEDDAVEYLKYLLTEFFIITKLIDGCLADIVIKPVSQTKDEWMRVQIKTTDKPGFQYSFKCSNRYHDCAILCVCLSDKRMWLLNGNEITVSKKIGIGLKKSKYSINEITKETIVKKLTEFYHTLPLSPHDVINVPISIYQQKEQEYRIFYQNKCDFLNFEYDNKSNMVYDFKINGLKIQEKIGSVVKKKYGNLIFALSKNNGTIDGIRKFQPYKIGDNDFYWLNFPDKRYFYVLPEHELIKHHYLADGLQKGKKNLCVNIKNGVVSKFDSKFLFDLENLDKDRLKNLFIN